MELNKKTKMTIDTINISFANKRLSTSELLLFIPGGPGLSSSYLMPFIEELSLHMPMDIALLDLPCHDLSQCHAVINYSKAGALIWNAINKLSDQYQTISIFAHSLGGSLLFNSTQVQKTINNLILCDVPAMFKNSAEFSRKKEALIKPNIETNEDFIDYFKLLVPLYFYDQGKFSPHMFWRTGCNWLNGKNIMLDSVSLLDVHESCHVLPSNVFLIEGDADIVLPDFNNDKIATKMKISKIYGVKEAGHFPFIESPEDVINILLEIFSLNK